MSNELTAELKSQIFKQESEDPFLNLVTLTAGSNVFRLVDNTEDVISRGETYLAFPMKVRMPTDDGESIRDMSFDFDNSSLLLIRALRSVTDPMSCKLEMVLASNPDIVQSSIEELQVRSIVYNKNKISAKVVLDNFLAVALTSEKYTPSTYPGIF